MILRRVIAHVRKQEWTAIAIDFVIVVAGVFVGIQVSNLNAARLERHASRVIIVNLYADYAATVREESAREDAHAAALAAIDALLADMRSPTLPSTGAELASRMAQVFEFPPAAGLPVTQEEITSSGQFNLITDPALRSMLAAHAQRVREAGLGEQARREFLRPYAEPVFRCLMLLLQDYPPEQALSIAGGRDEIRIGLEAAKVVFESEKAESASSMQGAKAVLQRLSEERDKRSDR